MRSSLAIPFGLFALAGCSSDPAPPPVADAGPPPIEALYGAAADTFLTPYPSDRYTVPDATTRGVTVGYDARYGSEDFAFDTARVLAFTSRPWASR